MIKITEEDILIIIDPQVDFCEGGALAVPGGLEALKVAANVAELFERIVVSQDWHPADHKSFASQHGVDPFTIVQLGGRDQVAWPDHCVQGSPGAELLVCPTKTAVVIRKGMNREIDSYSAFYENDEATPTGLLPFILGRWGRKKRVFFVGLARNYCVAFSVLDAGNYDLGELFIIEDATAAIPDDTLEPINQRLINRGVKFVTSDELEPAAHYYTEQAKIAARLARKD